MEFRRRKLDVAALPFVVRSKWGGKSLDEGFVPFPKRLLRVARKLFKGRRRMTELSAMLAIVDYERPSASRAASVEYLAYLSGLSKKSFKQCLADFRERKWIVTKGDEDGITIEYKGFVQAVIAESDKMDEKE